MQTDTINMKHIKHVFRSKALCLAPWVDLGGGVKRLNSTFSEHGHIAYQIKGNHERSKLVAIILPADPPPPTPPGVGVSRSEFNIFRTWSCCISEHGHLAYQIKENHECSNMVANILLADHIPSPTLVMGLVGQNSTFLEHGHLAYQNKENHKCSNMITNILPAIVT